MVRCSKYIKGNRKNICTDVDFGVGKAFQRLRLEQRQRCHQVAERSATREAPDRGAGLCRAFGGLDDEAAHRKPRQPPTGAAEWTGLTTKEADRVYSGLYPQLGGAMQLPSLANLGESTYIYIYIYLYMFILIWLRINFDKL